MAWADGQLSESEKSVLVEILVRLGYRAEEVESAPAQEEELPEVLADRGQRLQVLSDLVAVAFADRDLSLEEFRYLEKTTARLRLEPVDLMAMIKGSIQG